MVGGLRCHDFCMLSSQVPQSSAAASVRRLLPFASISCFLVSGMALTGCATGIPATAPALAATSFSGRVHGGQQPVTGSTVSLYATTSGGYGSAATLLGTTATAADGTFNFASPAACPAGQQAYMVASGGNPGITGTVNNSAIMLAAALSNCANLSAATQVDIDEVTTVAAAYALSGFVRPGGAGLVAGNITSGVGTSTTNVQGLTDAFANANNIVNFATGTAYTATPTANSTGVVPQATINSLANILQDCVNSSTPASNACVTLFANATPPTGSGVAAPVNVLQAAINIATYPGNNVGALYNEISASAAFQPNLTASPNDWTIGIAYTNPQIATPLGMAIDGADNVWVVGSTSADVAEFSPLGVPLSPNPVGNAQGGWIPTLNTTIDNLRNLSFDQTGNAWISDGATGTGSKTGLIEYTPMTAATVYQSYAAATGDANNYINAVDANGNVWTSSYKASTCATTGSKICDYVEFQKAATTPYTPTSTFGTTAITALIPGAVTDAGGPGGARGMAANAKAGSAGLGDIWAADNDGNSVQIFQAPYNVIPVVGTLSTTSTIAAPNGLSLDAGGNAWITGGTSNTLYQMNRAGTTIATIANAQFNKPFYLAIDGNGNIFVPNSLAQTGTPSRTAATAVVTGANTVSEYSPSFNSNAGAVLSPNIGFAPGATFTPMNGTTPAFVSGGPINADAYLAVDRAGALWVLSGGTAAVTTAATGGTILAPAQPSNLVQILGVAAPTNPVQAFGQYGTKP